ncbi:MAG: MBL fold metallo-hydrolase [Armatimonadota bacterium]
MRPLALAWLLLIVGLLTGCQPASKGTRPPSPATAPPAGSLQVVFFDVGQGDSALIRLPNGKTMLIDGGPPQAGRVLVAKLRQYGVSRLDWVVGTHPHSDHIGGLIAVLKAFPVEEVWDSGLVYESPVYRDYLLAVKSAKGSSGKRPRFRVMLKGESIQLAPNMRIEVLAPSRPYLMGTESDPNNNSIVLRLEAGRARFLFTGDMEGALRRRLYQQRADLRAEVLKVAHHGSHNGTDTEFLIRVRPRIAIISCGSGNPHGHPHKEALQALKAFRVRVYRTDRLGDVVVTLTNKGLEVVSSK